MAVLVTTPNKLRAMMLLFNHAWITLMKQKKWVRFCWVKFSIFFQLIAEISKIG